MKTKSKYRPPAMGLRRGRSWIFVLLILSLMGLYLTGKQMLPHLQVAYWKQQLAEARAEQVEGIFGQIAALDEVGFPVLVEALASEQEAVATAAKQCLLEQLERWKSLPDESCLTRLLTLADCLAERIPKLGPTARRDAAELAMQMLLLPAKSENSLARSRLIAACDEVLQSATVIQGDMISPSEIPVKYSPEAVDQTTVRSVAFERGDAKSLPRSAAATPFDPLPGGGLPLRTPPPEDQNSDVALPGEDAEMPPAFFQEPAGTRYMDFSNRTGNSLQVPEMPSLRKAGKTQPPSNEPPIRSLTHEESKPCVIQPPVELRSCETLDLMRQLAEAEQGIAEQIRAVLRVRGLTEQEIALAGRLFDPDPAERKRLVTELLGMSEIDASAWLMQCGKDPNAEVRLEAFSLLATSRNPLLLQKLKILCQNDADSRIQRLAGQIDRSQNR